MNIETKYTRAIQSSHLEVTEFDGDIDLLIAAGWVPESFGTLLYRLRAEWDTVNRREIALAANVETARLLTLIHLRSLAPFRDALGRFAIQHAARHVPNSTDGAVLELVGRVLDRFLDSRCGTCTGKGTTGGYGSPQLICTKCRGTGSRREALLSDDQFEHDYGRWLLSVMDSKLDQVARTMRRFMRDSAIV